MYEKHSTEELEEMGEAMQAVIGQLGPMMESIFDVVLTIFEKEELTNRMAWAEATRAGKLLDALQKNGFERHEALDIVYNQGSILSSMNSLQAKNR